MGNETSQPPAGLIIEENAIEVTDRWALHSASYSTGTPDPTNISVFVGVPPVKNNSYVYHSLLEKFAKNLKVHRHPCILKYVATWEKNGKGFHLATEDVKPLVQVLPNQTALQVCIGLQNILKALNFLHEMAQSSHNNVCRAAVYVTPDGVWKLGGLEYLCRFSELSSGYLCGNRVGRYEAALSPGEEERVPQPPSAVDRFAFGVLAEEVLSTYSSDDVPGMAEFRELCKTQLQNVSPAVRPSLEQVLRLPFFTHEFIYIPGAFTICDVSGKLKIQLFNVFFFRDLSGKLSLFPEDVVASQLGSLLLSRIVLLDTTAQQHLLPLLFSPRSDEDTCKERIFSESTFKAFLVPKLLPMFCVRDAHVRIILLSHFSTFCAMFSPSQLQSHILPELLVGIKDTNDVLVSHTLRALADMVPILGSTVVIGRKSRKKIFSDGRPNAARTAKTPSRRSQKSIKSVEPECDKLSIPTETVLPERLSPDGGEEEPSSLTVSEEETENWVEWEENTAPERIMDDLLETDKVISHVKAQDTSHSTNLPDITSLDIKSSSAPPKSQEVDYFQDMEPVISTNHIVEIIADTKKSQPASKFEVELTETDDVKGWGDDENWDDL
ncbi:protein-associating with the carboxyl-terminal domain of ezrin [Nilaparvata lugens]|uniref:protein-associating with the carboxyl-terminal domain of ezrin n=1 Tax=Nilaparvata lugens TaxID=108931 RepID=UPI00193E7DCD|nr:protein-associating with the carboxyl-terminal domain of ezrin [Nilaparvata lugens]